jgi:type I restriction enzyme S subunit
MAFTEDINELVEMNPNGLLDAHTTWQRVPLSSIADVINGFAFKSKEFNTEGVGAPLVRIRDVLKGKSETYYSGEIPEGYWIDKGDIVVGMDGDFNINWWSSEKSLLNQRVCKVQLYSSLYDKRYLYRALPGYLEAINRYTSSVTVKHLSSKTMLSIPMPLPPLNEQTRIANKLDELLAQVETIKARVDAIPTILKRFRQSVLAAAVSGKLTEGWRDRNTDILLFSDGYSELISAEHEKKSKVEKKRVQKAKDSEWFYDREKDLPKGWVQSSLIDITSLITCGVAKKPDYVEKGIPFLSAQNSKPFSPNLNKIKYISEKDFKTFTVGGKPEKGDVLYSRVGANFGEACVIPWEFDFAIYVSLTLVKPIRSLLNSEYLTIFLNSQDGVIQSRGGIMGSGIQNLNVESVRKYRVLLPSLEEQKQIVKRVEQLFTFADQIEQRVKEAQTRIDNLSQSILAKAFRGELVPQDPSDEPASELLARIQKEREEAAALAKAAKKTARKSRAKKT